MDAAEIGELAPVDRMHRLTYVDPAIFELEMERISASTVRGA